MCVDRDKPCKGTNNLLITAIWRPTQAAIPRASTQICQRRFYPSYPPKTSADIPTCFCFLVCLSGISPENARVSLKSREGQELAFSPLTLESQVKTIQPADSWEQSSMPHIRATLISARIPGGRRSKFELLGWTFLSGLTLSRMGQIAVASSPWPAYHCQLAVGQLHNSIQLFKTNEQLFLLCVCHSCFVVSLLLLFFL